MKAFGTEDQQLSFKRMEMATPDQAYSLGRSYRLRSDWENVKYDIMKAGLEAKFTQHIKLEELLLSTEGHLLIQIKPNDAEWGTGIDGKGLNMHGELLRQIRDEKLEKLKQQQQQQQK